MNGQRTSFPRALAGLIDVHLDDGAGIQQVKLALLLTLRAIGDAPDPDKRYLPEMMQAQPPEWFREAIVGLDLVGVR